ncbi:MAG TPA: hypothetical protein VHM20_01415, partial [Gammaproteobacteria bacterium]|nr:hypothetical protein [Gammaproteobacteria bacterium]
PKLQEAHDKLALELRESIRQKMCDMQRLKYYEEAIKNKQSELTDFVTNIPLVKLERNAEFEKAREELDKAWQPLLCSKKGRQEVQKFLSSQEDNLNSSKQLKDDVYVTMAIIFMRKKIKKYEKSEAEVKKNKSSSTLSNSSMQKNNSQKTLTQPRWYHLDKPWKKALLAGLIAICVTGLASSIFGLALGLSFITFVGILSGGLVATLGTGSFSIGFFGFLSWEYRPHNEVIVRKPMEEKRLGDAPKVLKKDEMNNKPEVFINQATRFFAPKDAQKSQEFNRHEPSSVCGL